MSAQALKKFTEIAAQAQKQIDKFKAEFDRNPSYALIWGTGVFQAAARLKVAEMLIYSFTERPDIPVCTVDQARKTVLSRVMSRVRNPAQSTSPTANLMEQYEAAAYAEALDYLNTITQ